MRIEGFSFSVTTINGSRECSLQGSGGKLGAGCLAAANSLTGERRENYIERVKKEILAVARHEAENTGYVREVRTDDSIEPLSVSSVDGVNCIVWPNHS